MKKCPLPAASILLLLSGSGFAQAPATYQPAQDWLVNATAFPAQVTRAPDGSAVTLENGLLRRVIRIQEGCATIAFDNLMTGETILRSVRPEGSITLDGQEIPIGGLVDQPDHAFRRPQWLSAMKADPKAMVLTGIEIGEPVERLAWKRIRHHAPGATWPPKGVALRMDFRLPAGRGGVAPVASDHGRAMLWKDDFTAQTPAWRLFASPRAERVSFVNEGKFGEIYALEETHCFAERALPADTRLIEAHLVPGTDRSVSWGPGLGVVFASGRVVKVNLRPGDRGGHGLFELRDAGAERLTSPKALAGADGGLDLAKEVLLRVRIEPDSLEWEAAFAGPGEPRWVSLFSVPRAADWGVPTQVRVGKTDRSGGAGDGLATATEWGRARIAGVGVYGAFDPARATPKAGAAEVGGVTVSVHYELYDGVPVLSKWITVRNPGARPVELNRFTAEILAVVEYSNHVEYRPPMPLPNPRMLHVETDQAFGGFNHEQANRHAVRWIPDPLYSTQVNYSRSQPCLLQVSPFRGPAQILPPGGTFESFRVFELVHDSEDRSRRGLALKRMYRTVAPWITENPLMFHLRDSSVEQVRSAIEQCAETGFEMIILSFGSGLNMESADPKYVERWRGLAALAREKGLDLGGYSLLSSRRIGGGNDVVSPPGESPTHGNCPALTSAWGQQYFRRLYDFIGKTGFTIFEHDGSYPGDWDTTARPPLQRGLDDSQWAQWRVIRDFYHWCRSQGVFLNIPDYYYLSGGNKCGMGYREVNWSLPRAQQVLHTRQNIYDGTWDKTPSMGWMFVPLSTYHGGGAAATVEPLDTHLAHYRMMMLSNLAMGVQACYRGPRLYDTDRTKAMVRETVAWYKKHRDILESDMIHLRRPCGMDWDGMLHVNPALAHRGMLVVFNPLEEEIEREIVVPLYYAGLSGKAMASVGGGSPAAVPLDGQARARLRVKIPAGDFQWVLFTAP